MQRVLNHKTTAILLPAIIGLGGAALSVCAFEQYGWSLFLGLPIVVSFLSAFSWCFKRKKSFGSAYGVSCLSILALGGLILIFALDGLICLLMALPLALVLALIGAAWGRLGGSSAGGETGVSWGLVSDEIIHRIHLRVLNHIKNHTETPQSGPAE